MLSERRVLKALCTSVDCEKEIPSFCIDVTHEELKNVRNQYHMPSYVITDEFEKFAIISDSDYYWGFAAGIEFVLDVKRECSNLQQTEGDIRPYLEGDDAHDLRIGKMLYDFHEVCDRSVENALSQIEWRN